MFEEKRKTEIIDLKPPKATDVLIRILKHWRGKHSSQHVPSDDESAARWWMSHQEERGFADTPQPITDKDGVVTGWNTPYHDRVSHNLRRFLALDEPQKAFVIHGIEQGIPYRGDEFNFYKLVVDETGRMNQQKAEGRFDEYITSGFHQIRRALKNMAGKK